jgi:uncharacterized protein
MKRRISLAAVIVGFVVLAGLPACGSPQERISLKLGSETFTVEVARSAEQREKGLMGRSRLPEREGMIFVFERDQGLAFWMKNTTIPLSVAYISSDGEVKEIHDLAPLSLSPVESIHAVRYALEVSKGTFERLGINPGHRLDLSALRVR